MEAVSSHIALSASVPVNLRHIVGQSNTSIACIARSEIVREICLNWNFEVRDNAIRSALHDFAVACAGGEVAVHGEHAGDIRQFLRQHGHHYGIVETGRSKFIKTTQMNAHGADALFNYIQRQGLEGCLVSDIVAENDDALVSWESGAL